MIILEKGERADPLWGMDTEIITDEMIEALEQGKRLYLSVNDEYAVVIKKNGKRKTDKPEATDTDTISRQAVLDAVDTITKWSLLDRNGCHVGVGMKYRDVKETVKSLPPSPSRPQWIPVTGRMPETNKDVLLTSWNGNSQYVGWLDDLGTWHSEDEEVPKGYEPIAWMPLPEPYEV